MKSILKNKYILNCIGNAYIYFAAITLFFLAACSPSRSDMTIPVDSLYSFSPSGSDVLKDKWWTSFNDSDIDTLVNRALQSNFDLEAVWYRLKAAQAVVDRESASFFPDLTADGRGEIFRTETESQNYEELQLGLSSSYEIDLWGRISSAVDAEYFRAKATHADYQTAALTLTAEVVTTWYSLMAAHNQLHLIEQQMETNEKVLSLIRTRVISGQIRSVDILRQKQLLESTREQKILAERNIEVLEHRLIVLLGKTPQQNIVYTYEPLPIPPPLPNAGLPADLIRRRPDVQSAFNQLQAADRDMAAAVSNQFPRLSLSASVSTTESDSETLFDNWAASFAGNLFAPIFNAGELSAEVDRAEAVKNQRLYEYGQTVLTAFREVEDALIQEKKQAELIISLEQQLSYAEKTYKQLRIEYFNGLSDYLDVLTALTEEQRLQREVISAKLQLLEYRTALYRALAGGFDTGKENSF